MKRRNLDTMREVRLWIVQVVVPLAGISMLIPDVRNYVAEKYKTVKNFIKEKIKKK